MRRIGMDGKPQDCMSVGLVSFMAFPELLEGDGPAVEALERVCGDDYFGAVEVTAIHDRDVRRRAVSAVKDSGKRAFFAAQPILLRGGHSLNSQDPAARRAAVDACRRALDEAVEWGARDMAVVSGPDPGPERRELERSYLMASLKEICEYSRSCRGPAVVLETFDRAAFARNRLVGPTADAILVARRVAPYFARFGLLMDLSHLPLLEEEAEEALAAAAQYLKHVHIGNCVKRAPDHPAYGDEHPVFGVPEGENGKEELAAFMRALLKIGYIGPGGDAVVSFEVKPFGDQTGEDVIRNCRETLDAAWALV